MVADKKDFEPKNRKRFIGRIATGEYDAVVIGHTQFEKIPMSKEYQEKHIQDQIDEILNYVEEYKHDRNQNFTVKQLEKTKKKLETRLEKLNDDFKKDDVITFEELGVEMCIRDSDMRDGLKTVTVKDNTEYLGGMITGSDVIPLSLIHI